MLNEKKQELLEKIKSWILIFVGCTAMCDGFVFFINPYNIIPGGVYGASIVLHNIFPSVQVGTFGYCFEIPLMLLSLLLLGAKLGIRTIVACLVQPLIMNVLSWMAYPDQASLEALDPTRIAGGLIDMSDHLMLATLIGSTLIGMGCGILPEPTRYFVRVPVFSFEKLQGTDVQIGDTEKSTGEVMGIADTFDEALLKGLIASGMRIKRTGGVLVSVADTDKRDSVMLAGEFLKQGFKIYATSNTAKLLNSNHVAANSVRKIHEGEPNTMSLIKNNKLSYVVSTAEQGPKVNEDDIRIRRTALLRRIPVLPSVDTAFAFAKCLENNNILEEIKVCKL